MGAAGHAGRIHDDISPSTAVAAEAPLGLAAKRLDDVVVVVLLDNGDVLAPVVQRDA
jgi:hypothetical protein